MYPLVYRDDWTQDNTFEAMTDVAESLGFCLASKSHDYHEDDRHRIIRQFVQHHGITSNVALERLEKQKNTLPEEYSRLEYRWNRGSDELILVLATENVIPFPGVDIKTTGEIWLACGFADFTLPDTEIDRLGVDDLMQTLPLLYVN